MTWTHASGPPSPTVQQRTIQALEACTGLAGGRHDAVRDHVLALVRYAERGEPGVCAALDQIGAAFVAAVVPDRSGPNQAAREFDDLVRGAEVMVARTAPTRLTVAELEAAALPDPNRKPKPDTPDNVLVSSWGRIDLAEILAGDFVRLLPTLLYRTDNIAAFYAGKLNDLHGQSESGKTWIALATAAGELNAGATVVWVDWEDDAVTAVGRLRCLGVEPDVIADRFAFFRPSAAPDLDEHPRFLALVAELAPTLVVIDGVTESMAAAGLDPNVAVDFARWVGDLPTPITALGPAVLWVDHVKRGNETGDAIGSVHKRNIIDGVSYEVVNAKPFAPGAAGYSRLKVTKDRPGSIRERCRDADRKHFADFHLEPDFQTKDRLVWSLRPPEFESKGDGMRPMKEMERVTSALAEFGDLNTTSLRGAVTGKNERVDLAVSVLEEEGYITVTRGQSNLHHLIRRYIAADDPKHPARGKAATT